jgi:hypothetical protein
MSDQGDAKMELLAGLVERVTFHNPDNGFCVLRLSEPFGIPCASPAPALDACNGKQEFGASSSSNNLGRTREVG